MFRQFTKTILLFISVFLFVFLISFTIRAWEPPAEEPPDGNVPRPLNIGVELQAKIGNLAVGVNIEEDDIIYPEAKLYVDTFYSDEDIDTGVFAYGDSIDFYAGNEEAVNFFAGDIIIGEITDTIMNSFSGMARGIAITSNSWDNDFFSGIVLQYDYSDSDYPLTVMGGMLVGALGDDPDSDSNAGLIFGTMTEDWLILGTDYDAHVWISPDGNMGVGDFELFCFGLWGHGCSGPKWEDVYPEASLDIFAPAGNDIFRARSETYTHFIITEGGLVGIGDVGDEYPEYDLHVFGDVFVEGDVGAGGNKYFVIDHPLNSNKKLVHSSLEGPESAVFYRGEAQLQSGTAIINLPDYFEALTRSENRTVQLTPKNGWSPLYVEGEIENGQFVVKTNNGGNQNQTFFWEVKAVRADVDLLEVERNK